MSLRKFGEYVPVGTLMSPLFSYMRRYASRTPDETYLLTMDPSEIDRIKMFPGRRVPVTGPDALSGAVGGPWDRLALPVETHYIHQSIRAYLEADAAWSETQIYEHPSYRDDPEKARRRCEKIERLIDSIAENDYQPVLEPDGGPRHGSEAAAHNERVGDVYVGDEIVVGLGRDGTPIHLKNGRHRLAVAQLLEIERIPVVVSMYHPRAKSRLEADARPLTPAVDPQS